MQSTIVDEEQKKSPRMRLWRNRDYMILWSGQTVSLVGTGITQTAFPLLVWDITHSAALVGLVGGLGALPYLLLSLMVGALIDRWNRKRVMILYYERLRAFPTIIPRNIKPQPILAGRLRLSPARK